MESHQLCHRRSRPCPARGRAPATPFWFLSRPQGAPPWACLCPGYRCPNRRVCRCCPLEAGDRCVRLHGEPPATQGRVQAAWELERGLTPPNNALSRPPNPSAGWPAAGHVNPDLSDRAACPGAANPLACDVRLAELTSLPGRAPAQRSAPQARPQRREGECPSACL